MAKERKAVEALDCEVAEETLDFININSCIC
jgi:hypothetical protein